VQRHALTFFAEAEETIGASLPQFIEPEFDAYPESGMLAHGFLRLRCNECSLDKLAALSCKLRGFWPSFGIRCTAHIAGRSSSG